MNAWANRTRQYTLLDGETGFTIDLAGMKFTEAQLAELAPRFDAVNDEMAKIEAGAIKNPDEHRKVTHFTDRAGYVESRLFAEVEAFAEDIHSGALKGGTGKRFDAVAVNGIGGSALGPQLMQFAINGPYWNEESAERRHRYLKIYFLDNTDSAGLNDLLAVMDPETTLHLTISKSGGTQETRNNLIALQNLYAAKKLSFAPHAVAITMAGSELDRKAREEKWLRVFEMAESIGGRTSETSIVGHLPAALTGVDFGGFLRGACRMDEWTRERDFRRNPAAMLAAMWYLAGNGKGDRNMVVVPYSDRLILLSRYLQQLVMESLGKELDLDGNVVHQGITVFGNKGGTDAHAFIQQLNDGRDDFFVTFIEVLKDAARVPVEGDVTMGDYLHGFLSGLASALRSKGRQVIAIRMVEAGVRELGMLIALYERAVAMYAELIHINAFHQPGVQAYKKAAKSVLELRRQLMTALAARPMTSGTAEELAEAAGLAEQSVDVAGWLEKAACNGGKVSRVFDEARGDWVYTVR